MESMTLKQEKAAGCRTALIDDDNNPLNNDLIVKSLLKFVDNYIACEN